MSDIIKAHDLTVDLAFEHLIADRSYGAKDFVDELHARGIEVVIPPNKNAKAPRLYDAWRYREWHLIVGKIKYFRRTFSRFDKLAKRYLGFLHFVSSLIWLR
ncbi:MAG: transposase [Anaerolineae bacterium]|nr:transposase [Anaerolineae bacterium]